MPRGFYQRTSRKDVPNLKFMQCVKSAPIDTLHEFEVWHVLAAGVLVKASHQVAADVQYEHLLLPNTVRKGWGRWRTSVKPGWRPRWSAGWQKRKGQNRKGRTVSVMRVLMGHNAEVV